MYCQSMERESVKMSRRGLRYRRITGIGAWGAVLLLWLAGCSSASDDGAGIVITGGSSTGGARNPVCGTRRSGEEVAAPRLLMNLPGQTSWYASPLVADLDGDGSNELIAAYYSLYVYDSSGILLDRADGGQGRIYAPHVVADLEGDGVVEIVYGNRHEVYAYEWRDGGLQLKSGWPADTTSAGRRSEVRGLAAADLDGDGTIEVVATTTQTAPTDQGGAQVFVLSADGSTYQPAGAGFPAWPRYNNRTGPGGDADRNGAGHQGYGAYGLNVALGDIDDDSQLEIIVTYDNHHIQAFNHDGVAIDASPWFRNRENAYRGNRMTWGQFIRWADPQVEENHYNLHRGDWPHPRSQEWLQWTASPPNIVDLDGDGRNEVLGVPNLVLFQGNKLGFSVPVVFCGKAQCAGNGCSIVKHCNAAAEHHRDARRVGLSASMAALLLLQRATAIRCEERLALNADRPTES